MKVWQETDELSEGKYLIVRRDGTIPAWASFVMADKDPASAAGLRGYADEAERLGYEPEYVASVRDLADKYEVRAAKIAANPNIDRPDPEAPPHRIDNAAVLSMMRGEGDLSGLKAVPPGDAAVHEAAKRTKAMQRHDR